MSSIERIGLTLRDCAAGSDVLSALWHDFLSGRMAHATLLSGEAGIGKKTAAKIMLTLKGKLTLEDSTKSAHHTDQAEFQDVINSLVDMGYDKRDVTEVVDRITDQLMENAEFTSKSHSGKEEMIFRQALVDLA